MSAASSEHAVRLLQERLVALRDLQPTAKHIHCNVVGPNFIAVHEMLDPQVDKVRAMSDVLAERIATMGASPAGTPGAIVERRSWQDDALGVAFTTDHLTSLDAVYDGVIGDHRGVRAELADLDPMSEDIIISQLADLELFLWFVRSHLRDAGGS
jgi:starvation-inducible DNA-binding protein